MEHNRAHSISTIIPVKIFKQKTSSNRQCHVSGKLVVDHTDGKSFPGKSVSVRVYSSTEIDPNSRKGKLSEKARLRRGKSKKYNGIETTTYAVKLKVDHDFGIPGALLVTNKHKHKFFLQSATLETPDNRVIHFDCRSWIYPFKLARTDRVFFSNTSYLPSETPKGLEALRREELARLRGDGTGERKEWERIYDYDCYNDLGDPEKGPEHRRPVLGGSESRPYPRRTRTGRPPCNADPTTESRPDTFILDVYVPPDERFSSKKLSEYTGSSIQAISHYLVPEAKNLFNQNSSHFQSFDEIRDLYASNGVEGWMTDKIQKLVPVPVEFSKNKRQANEAGPFKFPLPEIITKNELAWMGDEEFGRQILAGINAARIQCLEVFPPQGKNGLHSSICEQHIEQNLDGLTVEEALIQWRLFILDHHDYLWPFLSRINKRNPFLNRRNRYGICAYASRTLFFLRDDSTLKPVAIELSLPYSAEHYQERVFIPPKQGIEDSESAIWQLAKAHVLANDSAHHQLISHWLNTHAVVEPFIIATRRQLSVIHPIHRLLDPHFKDTMHANALARGILINSGGILEKILFTGEVSMELTSELYKEWRFDEQALPTDLLKRGMAFENPESPSGIQLTIEDYPYGLDGLEIWMTIKTWVTDFCGIFYKDDASISSDEEIQAWWSEIRNVGHGDKCNETWWYSMKSFTELTEALTTLIWISSALHAAVNFGQYAYAGYPPNRPMVCRKFIPQEGTKEFAEFLTDPDGYYLKMLPERSEMTLAVALMEVLSKHASDEVYLGQRSSEWTDNTDVKQMFDKFTANLRETEKIIIERNRDSKFRNRQGPAKIPYKLLYPDTSNVEHKGGITGKGIPNSITI